MMFCSTDWYRMDDGKGNEEVPVDAQDSAQSERSTSEENQVNSKPTVNGDKVDAGGQGAM